MQKKSLIVIPATGHYYPQALRLREEITRHMPWADVLILSDQKGANYYIEHLYFPMAVLMKFEHLLDIIKTTNYEFYFHFDADLAVVQDIQEWVFCKPFVCVRHSYLTPNSPNVVEQNKKSCAFMDVLPENHFQSAIFGGLRSEMVELCKTCSAMIDRDLSHRLVALWHDESYLNKFIHEKFSDLLPPGTLDRKYFVRIPHTGKYINPMYLLPENQYIIHPRHN
ncbi:MAG: hypothetical protein RR719_07560 [Akkermansia sp.]